ncbi:MAG: pyruvate kinase, partial [Bacteroidota bacterium]|nr:pyruvate kinase [Bacteroidota bacterium]
MKEIKKTKIVATLGPSSSDRETIKDMMVAGVNIFRINFSHADFKAARQRIELIRELNKELGFNVGVLADLQGPKLRVGKMKDDVVVEKGARIVFTTKKIEEGTNALVYMNYQSFPKDVKVGEQILLDDGKLIFEVASTDGQSEVVASVVQGGPLNSNKGVNLPNTEVSLPALTEKDV